MHVGASLAKGEFFSVVFPDLHKLEP